jgi:hypothetical protein
MAVYARAISGVDPLMFLFNSFTSAIPPFLDVFPIKPVTTDSIHRYLFIFKHSPLFIIPRSTKFVRRRVEDEHAIGCGRVRPRNVRSLEVGGRGGRETACEGARCAETDRNSGRCSYA